MLGMSCVKRLEAAALQADRSASICLGSESVLQFVFKFPSTPICCQSWLKFRGYPTVYACILKSFMYLEDFHAFLLHVVCM